MARSGSKIFDVPGASQIIDGLLNQKLTLDEIEEKTGFDRNCINRYKQKYWVRVKATRLKLARFDETRQLLFIQWPGQLPALQAVPENYTGKIRTQPGELDLIVAVQFEPAVLPRIVAPAEPEPEPTPELLN